MTIRTGLLLAACLSLCSVTAWADEAKDDEQEPGEASYNLEDCEPASDDGDAGADQKDLDECKTDNDSDS